MRDVKNTWVFAAGLLWALLSAGCATTDVAPEYGPLRAEVERLYLGYHDLKVVHSDLHAAARRHLDQADGQLSAIQSAARLIDQANLIAFYQWELLSITGYIRDGARADFFTLRVRDVGDARQKSEDLLLTIKVYAAFIRDAEALSLVELGLDHIQQNLRRYDTLQELMFPMANPPASRSGDGRLESF